MNYSRAWNGDEDHLLPGVEADDYWKACALTDPPQHPVPVDIELRPVFCLKWMLLWGNYLASTESGGLEGAAVERPRGRRYLTQAFERLRADLVATPREQQLQRLAVHYRLDLTVRWFELIDRGPETEGMRAAALDYYLTAWKLLADSPHDIEPFEYKFELGEQIKGLFASELGGGAPDSVPPEVLAKLFEFLKVAYVFHQLPMPSGADPKGRHYLEAVLTGHDGVTTIGIGYGVFPGEQDLHTLPLLASTDLQEYRRLMASVSAAKMLSDPAVVREATDEVDRMLLQRRIAAVEEWIERYARRGDRLAVLDHHRELRELYHGSDDKAAARKQQDIILALATQLGDRGLIARETVNRGVLAFEAEDYRAALKDLEGARDATIETGQGESFVDALKFAAAARLKLGMAEEPVDEQRMIERMSDDLAKVPAPDADVAADPPKLVAALRRWLDEPGHVAALRDGVQERLAMALYQMHEYDQAEAVFDQVIARLRAMQRKNEELDGLYFLLAIENARANLGRFFAVLADCERLGRELHGEDWDPGPVVDVPAVLMRVRDLHNAEAALQRRLDLERLAVLENPTGWIYGAEDAANYDDLLLETRIDLERGRTEDAARLQGMLARWVAKGVHTSDSGVDGSSVRRRQLRVLEGLAQIDFDNGEPQPALDKARQVLTRIEPLDDLDFWLRTKLIEGRSLLALHQDAGEAAARFVQLAPQLQQYKDLGAGRAVDLEIFLGDYYVERHDAAGAATWLHAADKLARELGLIDQQIEIHRKLGDSALIGGDAVTATREYRQAVGLVSEVSLSIPTDVAKVGYRGERSRAVAALVMALFEEYRRTPREPLLAEMLSAVEEGKSRALTEMVFSARGARPEPFELPALEAAMPADTALVEYYVPQGVRDVMLRFVVAHGNATVEALAPGAAEIESRVRALKDEAIGSAESYDEANFRRHAAALGAILLPAELRADQPAERRVYIVPTGSLYLFPYGLLADDRGQFLTENERLELAYLPNGALVSRRAPSRSAAARMVAYVNPAREPELSGFLGGRADRQTGFQNALQGWHSTVHWQEVVTEPSFVAELPLADNVLLYAHGRFVPQDPTSSYIRLADDRGRETVLSAEELLQLRVGGGLWVLAACSSGSGDVRSGDEVLGLPRSILQAGASMVVMSLWDVGQVPNWTLVNAVMSKISAGASVAGALREAQNELRRAGRPPYDWAAFILTGQHDYAR